MSSEILGIRYQRDAGQVFHVICFRHCRRTTCTHDFQGSVFQLVKVGSIILKSSEYDSLRSNVNSVVTSLPIILVLESTVFLLKVDICCCMTGKCKRKWQIVGSVWRKASYTARSLRKL